MCRPQDSPTIAHFGRNLRPVPERSRNYTVTEQLAIPFSLKLARRDALSRAALRACRRSSRCRSVVTIHDCIHLMFPQYLPNPLALRYARTLDHRGCAARDQGADRVGKLQAGHPPLRRHRAREDRRHLQRPRRTLQPAAERRGSRSGAGAIPAAGSVRALRREREASQEPRTADRRLRDGAAAGAWTT